MSKQTILIADDDSGMRAALSESLERCGYFVTMAENGSEALEMFSDGGRFEAVITDMRMPKMSGMEVLRGVKKISPDTPVIVITAYGTVNTAVEAMKEGASDFLMKPFSLDNLEFVVRNVLADAKGNGCQRESERGEASGDEEIIT
ncbi:MAG TPA: response regulator, partial [Syntrophales bacterium]|nr:response regulator [Syntrophales bacterium]